MVVGQLANQRQQMTKKQTQTQTDGWKERTTTKKKVRLQQAG